MIRIGGCVQTDHLKGLILTIVGVLVLTPDTLLIRLAAADHWTLVFWRGSLMAAVLFVAIIWNERSNSRMAFLKIGRIGVLIGICYGLGSVFFVSAVTYSGVANTLIIIASAPMFAAILARIILSELVPLRTVLAIIATFIGIAIVVSGKMSGTNLTGSFLALGTALVMAMAFVLVRLVKSVNMVPATMIGGILGAVAAYIYGTSSPFEISGDQIIWILLMGAVVLPISFGLVTLGPRYLPAPEVGLILLLETVLGPLWVWLVLDEGVSAQVLTGGAIVVFALLIHSIRGLQVSLDLRKENRG
jgi:drug/metabolite transporter (DMT)-like permease